MHSTYETLGVRNFQSIPQLAKDLFSKNYLLRKKAREELVEIGEPSLDVLIELANSKDETVRWEAMITIVQIGSQATLDVLLSALEDSEFSIRWLAAEGLINLGKYSIVPLLQELLTKPHSTYLRRGAHHVLTELRKTGLFKDHYALVETLANEFDHSNIALKVQKTIDSIRLT
jgi:HEAT repeat protein